MPHERGRTSPIPADIHANEHFMRHELDHTAQQRALGPAFWPLYATHPDTFEPYKTATGEWQGLDRMWMPPPEMEENYPIFRFQWGGGEPSAFHFMPGYPGVEMGNQTGLRFRR